MGVSLVRFNYDTTPFKKEMGLVGRGLGGGLEMCAVMGWRVVVAGSMSTSLSTSCSHLPYTALYLSRFSLPFEPRHPFPGLCLLTLHHH